MEEVTFEPGLLGGDEGQSSCPHFLIFHSFLCLHPWQSGLWHHIELLLARSSETFLWQINGGVTTFLLTNAAATFHFPPLPRLPCSPFSIFLLPSIMHASILPSIYLFFICLAIYLHTYPASIYLSMSLELRRVQ